MKQNPGSIPGSRANETKGKEMSHGLVYWVTRLDSLASAGLFLVIPSTLVMIIVITGFAINEWGEDMEKQAKKAFKVALTTLMISAIITVFIPTTKEAAAIYLIPKIANNEDVQKMPDNVAKILNSKLEEWIDDTVGKEQ